MAFDSGKNTKKLGFGLMRLPLLEDGTIDVETVKVMVDIFIKNGFSYFDTAYRYNNGGSEIAIRKALVERYPRNSYQLVDKLPAWWKVNTAQEAEQMFYTSLERTGAGYFDNYLLHNLGESRTHFFDDYHMWEYVQKLKNEGLIRKIGFSFHDKAEQLNKLLLEHPEVDFVQLQINYTDWDNPHIESRKCYETARKHGKPVIVMEPIKGGCLSSPPPAVEEILRKANPIASPSSWALRFAASLEGVDMVLSGMSNVAQMEENVATMANFEPLSKEEQRVILQAREAFDKIPVVPCTACRYCLDSCPAKVAIPGIFQAVNIYRMYNNLPFAKDRYNWNTKLQHMSPASACLKCGKCETLCPQHIHIRDELADAAKRME